MEERKLRVPINIKQSRNTTVLSDYSSSLLPIKAKVMVPNFESRIYPIEAVIDI